MGALGKFGGQKINLNPIPDVFYKMAGIKVPKTGLEIKNNKSAVECYWDTVAEAEKEKVYHWFRKNEKSTRTGRTNYDN